jgi:hypothetical protein
MKHFGCPEVYLDLLHSGFSFFVPLFFAIVYLVTFILNLGYIVEERANKTKVKINQYLIALECIYSRRTSADIFL